jgi:hypothetical protein
VTLVDTHEGKPICEAKVTASSSDSMNAYGDLDTEAFAEDLRVNFLRAIEDQLARAAAGMKLAKMPEVSPRRLASHGSSGPSEAPP